MAKKTGNVGFTTAKSVEFIKGKNRKSIVARGIKAWALIKLKNPKINALEIYEDHDIHLDKTEAMIRVEIKPCK